MYYNFYSPFTENELITIIPFVTLPTKETDKTHIWKKGVDRLDKISQRFYGHPYGAHLILNVNATLGTNEDDFEDGVILLIPYPYRDSLQDWINNTVKFKNIY